MTTTGKSNVPAGFTPPATAAPEVDDGCFYAANQAAQAISVALATTYTGLLLYNPLTSTKQLIVKRVKFALSVAPAAIAPIGLITGVQSLAPTGLTAVASHPCIVGSSDTAQGLVYSAATIATPIWAQMLWDGFTAAALPAPTGPENIDELVLDPGGFVAFGALTAVTGLGSFLWKEVTEGF